MTRVLSTSPQRPSDVVADVPAADPAAVAAADAARAAQREWARSAPAVRAAALSAGADAVVAHAGELAELVVREVGKPAAEARGEVARAVAILRYYAQQCFDPVGETYPGALDFTVRRPRGVTGLITPWNFPVAIPVWKAAPALAHGNAAVVKPSPEAAACALRLAELLTPHLPPGLLTVHPGHGDAGAALVDTADAVSFTGSTAVGRRVAARGAERGIAVQCEMGGLSAAIVLPDADVERAATHIASAAMGFAGQKCTATKRVIVVGDPAAFTEALCEKVRALRVGDPSEDGVAVGPLITEAARDRVRAARAGRVVVTGGDADGGWYAAPTVVTDLPLDAPLNTSETFGPLCTLTTAPDAATASASPTAPRTAWSPPSTPTTWPPRSSTSPNARRAW
ncbi:aldehyde dehydrogenase family protein [Actinokineospora soli]|uniref:Aldehyde dehydrogenase family protein n=1 Tax=Actinokineospora soli TaxID=1048753 RepID=A0ABW2TPI2_9PSEU